jgi:hypothetical protein
MLSNYICSLHVNVTSEPSALGYTVTVVDCRSFWKKKYIRGKSTVGECRRNPMWPKIRYMTDRCSRVVTVRKHRETAGKWKKKIRYNRGRLHSFINNAWYLNALQTNGFVENQEDLVKLFLLLLKLTLLLTVNLHITRNDLQLYPFNFQITCNQCLSSVLPVSHFLLAITQMIMGLICYTQTDNCQESMKHEGTTDFEDAEPVNDFKQLP